MTQSDNLSDRVIRGGFWVIGLRVIYQIFYFARIIIVARILSPDDFGLMGIAMLLMMSLQMFSQTGIDSALIQKKTDIQGYLDVAWTILFIRGVVLYLFLYLIAPVAARFFNEPDAVLLIQAIGLFYLFSSVGNIGVIYFLKELKFNKQFIYQGSKVLTEFVVAVVLAITLRNVWALVFGLLAGCLAQVIISYIIHPYRPRFCVNLLKVKELLYFGKWIFGAGGLYFLITQGDDIFVGKLLGVTMLGFYQMAYKISNTPATEISKVVSDVTFPAYSKIQDDKDKLRSGLHKVLQIITITAFPLGCLIFILAPDFTLLFLGQKWMPMVPAVRVLAVVGLIRSIVSTGGALFWAVGKPKIETLLMTFQLLIILALIYPFTSNYGLVGASIVILISMFLTSIACAFFQMRLTGLRLETYIQTIVVPLLGGIGLIVTIYLMNPIMSDNLIGFFMLVIAGLISYGFIIISLFFILKIDIFNTLKRIISQLRIEKNLLK
ncbi:MAG: lipopolysaccharide biosynthesis protein [Acidobacteria bacterium]|nr:lipopolysaccharide biosynthesis protein [Acidobacteriota bacterium]